MSKTITVSNEVYAAIVARRQDKNESESDILSHILVNAGNAEEIHAHKDVDASHLILDSEIDHTTETE